MTGDHTGRKTKPSTITATDGAFETGVSVGLPVCILENMNFPIQDFTLRAHASIINLCTDILWMQVTQVDLNLDRNLLVNLHYLILSVTRY